MAAPDGSQRQQIKERKQRLAQAVAQTRYFDAARWMGPRVYTDTLPLAANALLVVVAASALVFAPDTAACDAPLLLYLRGQLALSYCLLAFLAAAVMWPSATLRVTSLYRLLQLWCAGSVLWGTLGVTGLIDAEPSCREAGLQSAVVFYFAAAQTAIGVAAPGVMLLQGALVEPCRRCGCCVRHAGVVPPD
jgi:hypothetical protein